MEQKEREERVELWVHHDWGWELEGTLTLAELREGKIMTAGSMVARGFLSWSVIVRICKEGDPPLGAK